MAHALPACAPKCCMLCCGCAVHSSTPQVDPAVVSSVEAELLAILCGKAPRNTQITDYEEQFVVDEAKKTGQWQLVDKRIGQAGQAQ